MTILKTSLLTFGAISTVATLSILIPLLRQGPPRRVLRHKKETALPEGLHRIFIDGPSGKLEIVTNTLEEGSPKHTSELRRPVLFVHGGFGSAKCWERWMRELVKCEPDRHIIAISLRGHGLSDRPASFNRDTVHEFASDIAAAIKHIGRPPVLVGHSAGGGTSQYGLSASLYTVESLILLGPFPPSGGFPVYQNWGFLDLWYFPRYLLSVCDPFSPLSRPDLVKAAFFSHDQTQEETTAFFDQMNKEETLAWPLSMMFRFADPEKVLKNSERGVNLIGAADDKLMTPQIMANIQSIYRRTGQACELDVVAGVGHHMMLDTNWHVVLDVFRERLLAVGV